jgi:hypothetical protein
MSSRSPAKWRADDQKCHCSNRNTHKDRLRPLGECQLLQGRTSAIQKRTEEASTKHKHAKLSCFHQVFPPVLPGGLEQRGRGIKRCHGIFGRRHRHSVVSIDVMTLRRNRAAVSSTAVDFCRWAATVSRPAETNSQPTAQPAGARRSFRSDNRRVFSTKIAVYFMSASTNA